MVLQTFGIWRKCTLYCMRDTVVTFRKSPRKNYCHDKNKQLLTEKQRKCFKLFRKKFPMMGETQKLLLDTCQNAVFEKSNYFAISRLFSHNQSSSSTSTQQNLVKWTANESSFLSRCKAIQSLIRWGLVRVLDSAFRNYTRV